MLEAYSITALLILFISYLLYLKFKTFKTLLIIICVITSTVYMLWSFTVVPLSGISIVFGILLLLAELLGTFQFFNFYLLLSRDYKLERKYLKNPLDKNLPSIDILICTYNEPIHLLRKTIIAAKCIKYTKEKVHIYVCDDGHRLEVSKLCKDYSVNYITREDNKNAKAGNINNALKHCTGEFVSILDADMVTKENYLRNTVGYFLENPNLAFVQVPQSYYNQDMYQYNLGKKMPNEQDLFMRDIEEARASLNVVLFVGTNAIFRRTLLDSVGGFPTFSLTEDMALGMELQCEGYDSVFVNEPLVVGLSATTLDETIKQRKRWARGNLQVVKKNNPLFAKGLTFKQRLIYLDGVLFWFSSVQKMIYIIAPLAYLLFHIPSINATAYTIALFLLPFLSSQILIFKIMSSGLRGLRWSHFYEIVMAPSLSLTVITEMLPINKSFKFKVTAKDVTLDKKHFQFRIILPHLVLMISTIIAWIITIFAIYSKTLPLTYALLNLAWTFYNLVGLLTAVRVAYQKPIYRTSERVNVANCLELKSKIDGQEVTLLVNDVSDCGIGAYLERDINISPKDKIIVTLDGKNLQGELVRKTGTFIGIKFSNLSVAGNTVLTKLFIENVKPYYELNRDLHNKEIKEIDVDGSLISK